MRRTALILAAASAASLALATASTADAASAPRDNRLAGIASCAGGGKATLVSTLDAAGAEHAVFSAGGVAFRHWSGRLLLGADATASQPADGPTVDLTAKHGRFTTAASKPASAALNASGSFRSANQHGTCTVVTSHEGDTYEVVGAVGDLSVQGGDRRGLVHADAQGKPHHKYQFRFTAKTSAGVKHWKVVDYGRGNGKIHAGISTSRSRDIDSFTTLSVKVTDLTKHAAPLHLKLAR